MQRPSPFVEHPNSAAGASLGSAYWRQDESPLEELRLAAELARLMQRAPLRAQRPPQRPRPVVRRPAPPGSTREALATLLVRHANPLTPSRLSAPRSEPAAPLPAAELGGPSAAPGSAPPLAVDWLLRSRRTRGRARLAEAASWSLTVGVGALSVATAVWVLLGWPDDLGPAQRVGVLDGAAQAHSGLLSARD
jgi:hypothetical protein